MPHRPFLVAARSVIRRGPVVLGFALVVPIVAAGCSRTSAAPARRGGEGGPVPVVTAPVTEKDVPVDIAAIGNVEAYDTVTVQSQVTGQLVDVLFHEGDFVTKGQHLFTIDPRPFEAALAQAQANLSRDEALVAQAEAQLGRDAAQAEYQQLTAERNAELQKRGIISKDMAEQTRAGADATAALVKADKAGLTSAKAQLTAQQSAVDNAKVQLSYTVINSPLDGRTGNLAVKQGNLVTANGSQLITIQKIQPVYVTFAIPAVHLPTVKEHMGHGELPVTATPQDVDAKAATGRLTFVDNAVDPTTDTIKLKATFDNPDRRLWPGQFARVSLRLMTLPHAVVVPSEAVQTGQDGLYVFVVKSDRTVEQRTVVTGERVDQDMVIQKGLHPGETVVTEGQLRLEPGSKVQARGAEDADPPAPGQGRGRGRGQGQGRGARP